LRGKHPHHPLKHIHFISDKKETPKYQLFRNLGRAVTFQNLLEPSMRPRSLTRSPRHTDKVTLSHRLGHPVTLTRSPCHTDKVTPSHPPGHPVTPTRSPCHTDTNTPTRPPTYRHRHSHAPSHTHTYTHAPTHAPSPTRMPYIAQNLPILPNFH